MFFSLVGAVLCAAPCPVEAATELWMVAPDRSEKPWTASDAPREKARAVVLLPGLFIHPIRPAKAAQPWLRDWQEPKSDLVKALAPDFDVFSFSYAQTIALDEIAKSAGMRDAIVRLRKAGYAEIVLVGHSAGGVIARQFVENYPTAGVTKVIAVAAPFAGVELANAKVGYPKVQAPFVQSLAPAARAEAAKANKNAPGKDVSFACVVCKLWLIDADGLVPTRSQWTDDLQKCGVPIVCSPAHHFVVMQYAPAIKSITELAREKLVRWSPEETERARKVLFGGAVK